MQAARPLQLDQWANTKAPLTTAQRASVNRLAEWLHQNSSDYKNYTPASHPTAPTDIETASVSEAVVQDARENESMSLPDARNPLTTAQDFLAWYTSLTDSISSSTTTAHAQALARIAQTTASADSLLSHLEQCQVNVSELRAGTAFVQDSSKGLRQEAQTLLDSQLHLDNLSEQVASRLSFFTLLPYATSLLSSPNSSIVYTQEFLDLMDQLEVALAFLQQDPARTYKDAALYRMRYAQCVTRAATLAKLAVVRDLKTEADQLTTRMKEQEAHHQQLAKGKSRQVEEADNDGSQQPISNELVDAAYRQIATLVARLRPLVHELEKRASVDVSSSTAAEFDSLLQECKLAYVTHRRPALARMILSKVLEIETSAASHPDAKYTITEELARSGSTTLSWFVEREVELYHTFFAPTTPRDSKLTAYLAELAEVLIGKLRLRIAKETDVAILARIYAAMTTRMPASSATTAELLTTIVHETQSRLVTRAHAILTSDVGGYTPRQGSDDLDFPRRIEAFKSTASPHEEPSQPSLSTAPIKKGAYHHHRGKSGAGLLDAALAASSAPSGSRSSPNRRLASAESQNKVELFTLPEAVAATYYTPVLTLLGLLYHLQTQVPAPTLHTIASAGVQACLTAVSRGAELLVKQQAKAGGSAAKEEGLLFEIRQLEILREVVVSADLVLRQAHEIPNHTPLSTQAELHGVTGGGLVDLSSLVAAINSLWTSTGGRFLYSTNADTVEMESSSGTQTDASRALSMEKSATTVDERLQQTLQTLADMWASAMDFPLKVLLSPPTGDTSAAAVPPSKFESTYHALLTCVESVGEEKAHMIATWIEDGEVGNLLVQHVLTHIGRLYTDFLKLQPDSDGEVGSQDSVQCMTVAQLSTTIRSALLSTPLQSE